MTGDARRAVALSFFLNGLAFASWASRIPDVRHTLALSNQALGLLLLGMSTGAVLAMSFSGGLVQRFGTAGVIRAGCVAVGVALLGISLGVSVLGSAWATVPFLFCYGAGTGVWDVAMNVEGADVERRLGRSIMPRFHAAFSLGTVVGAGLGALMTHLNPDLTPHLATVAAVIVSGNVLAARGFLVRSDRVVDEPSASSRRAWREHRTLLIGLVVLAMALAEGTANDWLAVALKDGYDVVRPVAVLGFALFVGAMTLGRVIGPVLLDRFGRVPVLLGSGGLAGIGVLLTVFGSVPWLVVPGIAVWGLGAALGFPVGMSAAADDPAHAAARVGVVSTIGYTAFLAGPPLLGFVAAHVGTLDALLVVLVVLLPATLAVPATKHDQGPE